MACASFAEAGRSSCGTPWLRSAMSRPRSAQKAWAPAEHRLPPLAAEAERPADEAGLLRHRREVDREHVREDQRVGDAVRDPVPRAERVGERVAGGGVDRPEADAAVEGREREAGPRLDVGAVLDRAAQVAADELDPAQRIVVDDRVRAPAGEGLDAVRHRVDPGRRRHHRRHRDRQLGVDDRDVGEHLQALGRRSCSSSRGR